MCTPAIAHEEHVVALLRELGGSLRKLLVRDDPHEVPMR
jgi:hypothetical protein